MRVIFDRFDTVSDLRGRKRTYENIKAAVFAAGKFSCFDVETEKDGRMFTKLCHDDPEIETFDLGYPWTGVRRRTQRAADLGKRAHVGDPCIYCGVPHDNVGVGDFPNR